MMTNDSKSILTALGVVAFACVAAAGVVYLSKYLVEATPDEGWPARFESFLGVETEVTEATPSTVTTITFEPSLGELIAERIVEQGCSDIWTNDNGELQFTGCDGEQEKFELTVGEVFEGKLPHTYEIQLGTVPPSGEFWPVLDDQDKEVPWVGIRGSLIVEIDGLPGPTLNELIDRVEVLEKTILACCGTEFGDPEASEGLEVLAKFRKQMEELEVRILVLEEARNAFGRLLR